VEFCRHVCFKYTSKRQKNIFCSGGERRLFVQVVHVLFTDKYSQGRSIFFSPHRETKGNGSDPIAQRDQVDQEFRPAPGETHGAGSQKNGKLPSFELLETLLTLAVETYQQKHRPQRHSTKASPLGPCRILPSRQPAFLPPEVLPQLTENRSSNPPSTERPGIFPRCRLSTAAR